MVRKWLVELVAEGVALALKRRDKGGELRVRMEERQPPARAETALAAPPSEALKIAEEHGCSVDVAEAALTMRRDAEKRRERWQRHRAASKLLRQIDAAEDLLASGLSDPGVSEAADGSAGVRP